MGEDIERKLDKFEKKLEQQFDKFSLTMTELKILCADTSKDVKLITEMGCKKGETYHKHFDESIEKTNDKLHERIGDVTKRIDRFKFVGSLAAIIAAIGSWLFSLTGGK